MIMEEKRRNSYIKIRGANEHNLKNIRSGYPQK